MYGNIGTRWQDHVSMDGKGQDQGNIGENHGQTECKDINAIIELLDGYTEAGGSRIKIDVVEGRGEVVDRQYHHGRCDVGSPWACGTAFDVLE